MPNFSLKDHNGSIEFISEKNKGTTFYIFLPLAELEEPNSSKVEENHKKSK